jgi:intracellular septation protein A
MSGADIGLRLWTYRRRFEVDGLPCQLDFQSGMKGVVSLLTIAGVEHGCDFKPIIGEAAVENHIIRAQLPSGKMLEVEAGYCSWLNVAVAVRLDGATIHESHPGTKIELPERARQMMLQKIDPGKPVPNYDPEKLKANRVPVAVDIVLGLLFFVIGKYVGLTEAALLGAAAGIMLMIVQRITKIDLLGGLASFGIVMLLISAGFAVFFQDQEWVKQRSTIVGLIGAGALLTDGLLGGRWLGQGMVRYVAYTDIVPWRLAFAMGLVGVVMAGSNWLVARAMSTDFWLFYTTFVDFPIVFVLAILAVQWSRRKPRV